MGPYPRPPRPRASRFGLLVASGLSSLSRPASLESPGLAFRGSPVQRGERSLDVRLFPPHPCMSSWPRTCGCCAFTAAGRKRSWVSKPAFTVPTSARSHRSCASLRPRHWPIRGRQAGQIQRRSYASCIRGISPSVDVTSPSTTSRNSPTPSASPFPSSCARRTVRWASRSE